jgi:photosystem II stability/assembly factor-like uncharacterized protein
MKAQTDKRPAALMLLLVAVLAWGDQAYCQDQTIPTTAAFAGLKFRNIGPATMGGRIDDFAVLESNPAVFYVAVATGGLWKTTNNGTTWEALFADQDSVSIGDVAIAPNDANLVWVGTGENNNRQSSSWGNGVYKSVDGGHTWKNMGLVDSMHIARIIVDPIDNEVVYVAALGHLWGPNKERGVYKTTDGGRTWNSVLYVSEDTGATELVMDPSNNKVLYAATYQRRRSNWGFNGGGPGSAIFKTTDAGRTWAKLTNGIPEGTLGRIGLDIYRKNPNVLYARIEHEKQTGLYRSDDSGASWRKISETNPRPMYFSQVRIDPNDDHRIYVLGVELLISDDGGKTFVGNTVPHSDHHALWIDPSNSNHVITGSDGGINISYDRGVTWDFIDNLDIGQFYHVSFDMDMPYRVYGGLQDNASWGGPSAVRSEFGIGNFDWFTIGTNDGFVALADPKDSRTLYSESQGGNMNRVDRLSLERKNIRPEPARGEPPLRWNWDTPMLISPHDSKTVYVAANKLLKSSDRGQSWKAISPDLTAQIDRETLGLMGVPAKEIRIAKNDGLSSYGTLVTIAESPKKAGLLYTGADDGSVYVSRDGGANWTNISTRFPGLPKNTYVSRIAPSGFDEGTVYGAFDNHREDDYHPYVYVSTDYGDTWRSITSNLPQGQAVRCITEDLKNPNVLYVGTEFGLFVSLDKGGRWTRVKGNLPTVPIAEITLHPRDNDMLLATHGRSIWILDDLTPFQQAAQALAATPYLFDIRPAMQLNLAEFRPNFGGPGDRRFWGKNPEPGAAISYYLGSVPKELVILIRDASGTLIREISGEEVKAARSVGINRIQWDLRHQPLSRTPLAGVGGVGGTRNGPFVLPGEYRVALVLDGKEVGARNVRVHSDASMPMTDADRKVMHDTAFELHQLQRTAAEAAEKIAAISGQVAVVQNLLGQVSNPPTAAKALLEDLAKRLSALRRQFGVPAPGQPASSPGGPGRAPQLRNQIASVKGQIMASTSPPTEQQMRMTREAREDLAKAIAEINDAIASALPALYRTLAQHDLQPALQQLQPIVITPKNK